MASTAFYVMLVLPSFAFAFMVLATFYGSGRAYIALSWVPVVSFVLVNVFGQLSAYQPSPVNWHVMSEAVAWTGLCQCVLGAGLAVHAARRGQRCVGLLLAACLTGVPYVLGS